MSSLGLFFFKYLPVYCSKGKMTEGRETDFASSASLHKQPHRQGKGKARNQELGLGLCVDG